MPVRPRPGPRARIRFLAALAALAGTACVTTVVPPPRPAEPAEVFVLDYGRHASLVLPEEAGRLVEYAYGDWGWFAKDRTASYDVFPTLLWPTRGTLGRRTIDVPADAAHLRAFARCEEVHAVLVARADAAALAVALDEEFERNARTRVHQPLYDLDFVHADTSFWLFHNCNHAVADWLRSLGCEVRGGSLWASFVVRPRAEEEPSLEGAQARGR